LEFQIFKAERLKLEALAITLAVKVLWVVAAAAKLPNRYLNGYGAL
jgi:hypothetical protein